MPGRETNGAAEPEGAASSPEPDGATSDGGGGRASLTELSAPTPYVGESRRTTGEHDAEIDPASPELARSAPTMGAAGATAAPKLGTFLGVFTPTALTILGVIMYLRLGWVVGHAGLIGALAIVLFSNAITAVTALSMSALATNMRVGVGGAYFIISRSLGLELGGAIGIPLYLSQTLSVTLYAYGLAETVRLFWPAAPVPWLAAAVVVGVTLIAAKGAALTLKLQVPLLVVIILSLVSLLGGVNWAQPVTAPGTFFEEYEFWAVFAVFFPAVTGILAGVSLSGDLKDPSKSIPRGVLGAGFVGFLVYMVVPVALSIGASADKLRTDEMVWLDISVVPLVVILGMWGAILSSAFGSILGAPRTLQALAEDDLAPRRLGTVDPASGEPLVGLRLSGGVALVCVALGDLNAVATWVTAFFLTTYGALNLVAALESLVAEPSFRPLIRFPWWLSLLGAVGCFVAMAAISPLACFVALAVESAIFMFLSRRSLESTWGDVRTGLWLSVARYALLRLRHSRLDPRNWRPNILVFSMDLERTLPHVRLAIGFGNERGIVTVVTLLTDDAAGGEDAAEAILAKNRELLASENIQAFCEVASVPSFEGGLLTVTQTSGIGGLMPNTVMFGWPGDDPEPLARLLRVSRDLDRRQRCTLVFRPAGRGFSKKGREMVLWWRGKAHNGDLMLLLAHLLSGTKGWNNVRIVLKTVVTDDEEAKARKAEFEEMVEDIRIPARVETIRREEGETVDSLIHRHSKHADLVFLGMSSPAQGQEEAYAADLLKLLGPMPSTVLVRNAGPFRGRLV